MIVTEVTQTALSVVNVCMSEFTASLIRHNLKGLIVDDAFLADAKAQAIAKAKNTGLEWMKADEAETLNYAVAVLEHLIDLSICSGRNLSK